MGVVRAHLQMKQGEDQEEDRHDWGYMRKNTEGESIPYTVACISKGSFLESATAVWPKSGLDCMCRKISSNNRFNEPFAVSQSNLLYMHGLIFETW
jgi:hypothetical protein